MTLLSVLPTRDLKIPQSLHYFLQEFVPDRATSVNYAVSVKIINTRNHESSIYRYFLSCACFAVEDHGRIADNIILNCTAGDLF